MNDSATLKNQEINTDFEVRSLDDLTGAATSAKTSLVVLY